MPSREQWKSMAFGAAGVFLAAAILAFGFSTYVLWVRARNGETAYEYLQKVIDQQQAQVQKAAPPAK